MSSALLLTDDYATAVREKSEVDNDLRTTKAALAAARADVCAGGMRMPAAQYRRLLDRQLFLSEKSQALQAHLQVLRLRAHKETMEVTASADHAFVAAARRLLDADTLAKIDERASLLLDEWEARTENAKR